MAIASGRYQLKSIIDCLGLPASEAYVETSSNNTATQITSGASSVFPPTVGSATGSPVTPSGISQTRSIDPSATGDGAAQTSSPNGGSKLASGPLNLVPALAAAGAIFFGMALVA